MLHLNAVTLRIAGRLLLEDASIHLPAGQRVGLVGRNGSGKTTLLRMIRGEIQPDLGEMRLRKNIRIGWVAQEAPSGKATPRETVMAAIRPERRIPRDIFIVGDVEGIAQLAVLRSMRAVPDIVSASSSRTARLASSAKGLRALATASGSW
jgi:ATP-binding cassette subfamily F protein 3